MYIVAAMVDEKAEAIQNSEEIKPVALPIVKLCLVGGIRQSAGRQSVSQLQ